MAQPPDTAIFATDWARHHASLAPVGWMLRTSGALPWVRFHALPDSKRYAEEDSERQVILGRANDLAEAILGDGASCWTVSATLHDRAAPDPACVAEIAYPNDEALVYGIRACLAPWHRGRFDQLLTAIAGDEEPPTLWFDRASGAIFAPYDGGFDLFPGAEERVQSLRCRYREWLSAHPAGL